MLKVLGSIRLTIALVSVMALLFVLNPPFQPPATAPISANGTAKSVLAMATSTPEQPQAATASSPATDSKKSSDDPPKVASTLPALSSIQTSTASAGSTPQPQQPAVVVAPSPGLQPIIQQVAAPVTQPVQKVVATVTKPICVNTKLLTLKLDTCLQI